MYFLWLSARKDLLRFLRDPLAFAIWLAMPLVMLTVLGLAFGRDDALPQGKLLVADEDASLTSRAIPAMLERALPRKMLTFEYVDRTAGRTRAGNGEASALLIIPKGFGAAALSGKPTRLELFTNPAERMLPSIIEQSLALGIETARSGMASKIALKIELTADPSAVKRRSFAAWFFPGMLMFSLLGIAQSMSQDLWKERDFGALRRYISTARDPGLLLAGKLLVVMIVDAAVIAFGIAAGVLLLDITLTGQAQGWLWLTISGGGLYLMMSAMQVYSANGRGGHIIALFVLFLFSMVGGSFFPAEFMPSWLAAIGRLTPNGWTVQGYKGMIDATLDLRATAVRWIAMLAACAILFTVVRRRLKRGFA